MLSWVARGISFFLIVISATACSGSFGNRSGKGEGLRLSTLRPKPVAIETVNRTLSKKKFIELMQQGSDLNKARLVQVFAQGEGGGSIPEYRVFDVRTGSVYELIGFETADILVAANDFVIMEPQLFWKFLWIMPGESQPEIEIRRAGKPMLFKYTFID